MPPVNAGILPRSIVVIARIGADRSTGSMSSADIHAASGNSFAGIRGSAGPACAAINAGRDTCEARPLRVTQWS